LAKDGQMLATIPFLLIFGIFTKGHLGQYIQTYYMSYIGLDIVRKLRDRVVVHLTYQDMEFFHKIHTGEILSRVTTPYIKNSKCCNLNDTKSY